MYWSLVPYFWWSHYLAGLATASLVANAPLESLRSHGPTPRIRTPLLSLHVSNPRMPRSESRQSAQDERRLYLASGN